MMDGFKKMCYFRSLQMKEAFIVYLPGTFIATDTKLIISKLSIKDLQKIFSRSKNDIYIINNN